MAAFLKTMGKFILNRIKKVIANKASNSSAGKSFKKIALISGLSAFALLMIAFLYIFGAVFTVASKFADFFKGLFPTATEEEYDEWINDPAKVYEFLLDSDDFTDGDLALLDKATLERIFAAINEYNERRAESLDVTYEYKYQESYIDYEYPETDQEESSDSDEGTSNEEEEEEPKEEEEPVPVPVTKYRDAYDEDTVTLNRGDIEAATDLNGKDMFEIRWQPIVAFAAYVASENFNNWGDYGNEYKPNADLSQVDLTEYYLSDDMIDEIIEIFYFRTTYRYDAIARNKTYYDFDDFCDGSTEVAFHYSYDSSNSKETYVPASAPMTIKNSFVNYTYNYVPTDKENIYRCDSRSYTLAPQAFLEACKAIVPDFDADRYVESLALLPGCEDLYDYYANTVIPMGEGKIITTYTTTDPDECPTIGVLFYTPNGISDGALGGIIWDDSDLSIPLFAETAAGYNVIPGHWLEDVEVEGKTGKVYYISRNALRRCDVSDNLSEEQIYELLSTAGKLASARESSPLLSTSNAMHDTARCLYDYQQETGDSVLALLAITTQEGAWKSTYAKNGWNFFNIRPYGEYPSIAYYNSSGELVTANFANFKAVYENKNDGKYETPCVNALYAQISTIGNNYWRHSERMQNNFYLMCWNGYITDGNVNGLSGIWHSYCPPWQDNAMPYAPGSYYVDGSRHVELWKNATSSYRGWINNCAYLRSLFEYQLGISYEDSDYESGQ